MQYWELVEIHTDKKVSEWKYLMLSHEHFNKMRNWITINGKRVAVIVCRRKLSCWHCGETSHFSTVCPANKKPQGQRSPVQTTLKEIQKENGRWLEKKIGRMLSLSS